MCIDNAYLNASAQEIMDDGGEGAILRKVGSLYEHGRNPFLLKLKSFYGDKEGIVVAINEEAVTVRLPTGIPLRVPSQSVQVSKLAIGDVVSFSYESYGKKYVPVNPTIYRIRSDLSWEEVVQNSTKEKKSLNEHLNLVGFVTQPHMGAASHMREYIEHIAAQNDLDPLVSSTWYQLPLDHIRDFTPVVRQFKSYANTIKNLFPNIEFDNTQFLRSSWISIENRRKFFENYAKRSGFSHTDPNKWYSQSTKNIMDFKGASRVIAYHENSVQNALMDLFPDIGLNRHKFYTQWSHFGNRKKFFENYAKENGFDPLNLEIWYHEPKAKILATKGVYDVISYHKGRVSQALSDLFPGFDKSKYQSAALWNTVGKRKMFFEQYGKDNGFDSHKPDNWYNQSRDAILSTKGAYVVISYHNNNLSTALLELFPNIGLQKSKLLSLASWQDVKQRRKIFERYAKENNFDPLKPENWYSQPRHKLLSMKGAFIIKAYYKGSLGQTMLDLFPNIGLKKSKFLAFASWDDIGARKEFFENFATENGFDPLIPDNWYKCPREQIMSFKGASGVIYHHNNSISQALLDLFPDIGLENFKFWAKATSNRKKFFEDIANENGFDPTDPTNWLSPSLQEKILADERAASVTYYHKGSLTQALVDLFHKHNTDKAKLWDKLNKPTRRRARVNKMEVVAHESKQTTK